MEKENAQPQNTQAAEADRGEQKAAAERIIRNHVYMSLGVSLIPLPLIDFVAVTGIQLNMTRKLAETYSTPFAKDLVKNSIACLLGGAFPASVRPRIVSSLAKAIPGPGQALGVTSAAVVAGASTYAVGKVFSRHFAEGGTFLTFNPEKAKAYYEKMFQEGKEAVAEMKAKMKGEKAAPAAA